MDYKVEAFNKKLTGTVNLSPIALNYRYVDRTLFPNQNTATPKDFSWFPSRQNTFQLKVSKYITANIFLYPRFDDGNAPDDDLGYWQFKEYTSIGLSYSF